VANRTELSSIQQSTILKRRWGDIRGNCTESSY